MSVLADVERLALRGLLAAPGLGRAFGPPPVNRRGVALDRDTWIVARLQERVTGSVGGGDPAAARRRFARSSAIVAGRPAVDLAVEDTRVPGGPPVRVYRPMGGGPALVWLHGGGWVVGDLETHDGLCRRLAAHAGCVVVAVDYRLAPEHPFPAGLEDALAAVRWARGAGPGDGRLALGGDSAGGNLAAAVTLVQRDAGERPVDLQVLVYPAVDWRREAPSHAEFATGFVLTEADIRWFQSHYRPPDPLDPRVSPLLAPSAAGLPPAIVTTAGFDPLRDEGEAWAGRLREAGVPVTWLDEAALVHGYTVMDGVLPAADAATRRLVDVVRAWAYGPDATSAKR